MPERVPFEYVLVRVVPRVERGECVNAGVIVICRPRRFLAARVRLDRSRVLALSPGLPQETLDVLDQQLQIIPRIAAGDYAAGPISSLEPGERWHWLSAPSSTMIQPSAVHTGLCVDPEVELDELFLAMVETESMAEQAS